MDIESLIRSIVREELAAARPAPAPRPTGSLYPKRDRLYLRYKDIAGRWRNKSTPYRLDQREHALTLLRETQEAIEQAKRERVASRRRGGSRPALDKPGHVYVIALIPEFFAGRLKIGFTAQSPEDRLCQIRCTNPYAKLLGHWPGTPLDETRVHLLVDGRVDMSEVFDTRNPAAALEIVAGYFASERAPA